jgi:predicted dehydrogenase
MGSTLRLALLGCGEGARQHHLPLLRRLPGVELAVVADPAASARDAAARIAPEADVVEDWTEALAIPGLDAAVICLPNALHAAAAIGAFERGVNVYVEKPLATTLDDAERVVAARSAAGLVGMMGFNYRFNRVYRSAREVLASGRLGPLVAARTAFTLARTELPEWKRSRAHGGGALLDLASHHVDLARWLLEDEVADVSAALRSRHSEDDTALLELRFAGGPVVQSLFGYGIVEEERFEVYGEAARLVVDRRRYQAAVVEPVGAGRLARATSLLRDLAHVGRIAEKRFTPGHEPSHRDALGAFVSSVRAGTPASPSLQDGLVCAAVLEAAERAAAGGGRAQPASTLTASVGLRG